MSQTLGHRALQKGNFFAQQKRTSRFFPTKEEAEEFIQEHYKAGSVQLVKLSLHEKHVLGVIRQSSDYTPDLLLL